MGLTHNQKQALIENLQLEITERARSLRAQYALQAQGLRTRVEIRVNRIPVALRRVKMGDLLSKHNEASKKENTCITQTLVKSPEINLLPTATRSPQRGTKRMSNVISVNKENNDEDRSAPKRSRTCRQSNAPSRIPASQVLSPRSINCRVIPKSPARLASPAKPSAVRPMSPQKPSRMTALGEPSAMPRNTVYRSDINHNAATSQKSGVDLSGETRRGRRLPPATGPKLGRGRGSAMSHASDSSTVTVKKTAPAKKVSTRERPIQTRRGVMGTIKGIGGQLKATTAKKVSADPPVATSGRVLRTRK